MNSSKNASKEATSFSSHLNKIENDALRRKQKAQNQRQTLGGSKPVSKDQKENFCEKTIKRAVNSKLSIHKKLPSLEDESVCDSSVRSSIGMTKMELQMKLELMKKAVDGYKSNSSTAKSRSLVTSSRLPSKQTLLSPQRTCHNTMVVDKQDQKMRDCNLKYEGTLDQKYLMQLPSEDQQEGLNQLSITTEEYKDHRVTTIQTHNLNFNSAKEGHHTNGGASKISSPKVVISQFSPTNQDRFNLPFQSQTSQGTLSSSIMNGVKSTGDLFSDHKARGITSNFVPYNSKRSDKINALMQDLEQVQNNLRQHALHKQPIQPSIQEPDFTEIVQQNYNSCYSFAPKPDFQFSSYQSAQNKTDETSICLQVKCLCSQQNQQNPLNTFQTLVNQAELIDKLEKENRQLRADLESRNNDVQLLKDKASDQFEEFSSQEALSQRIQQQLRDKIKTLQEECYDKSRDKEQCLDLEEEMWAHKLNELQSVLQDLEQRFELKEEELEQNQRNLNMVEEELNIALNDKNEISEALERRNQQVDELESRVRGLTNQISAISKDRDYFRDKFEDMQGVIEGCSDQMQEFDQVNSLSCQLIEKLQSDVSYYKQEVERCKSEIDHLQRNISLQKLSKRNDEALKIKDLLTMSNQLTESEPCPKESNEIINIVASQPFWSPQLSPRELSQDRERSHPIHKDYIKTDSNFKLQRIEKSNFENGAPKPLSQNVSTELVTPFSASQYQIDDNSKRHSQASSQLHGRSSSSGRLNIQLRNHASQRYLGSAEAEQTCNKNYSLNQMPSQQSLNSAATQGSGQFHHDPKVLSQIAQMKDSTKVVLHSLDANIARLEAEHEKLLIEIRKISAQNAAKNLTYWDGHRNSFGDKVRAGNAIKKQMKRIQLELQREKRIREDVLRMKEPSL